MENHPFLMLGDQHNGGQAVSYAGQSDVPAVFKPRSAATELAFNAFLHRLEREGFPFVPGCAQILASGRDWHREQLVPHTPAQSEQDVVHYCQSCGSLVFLAYLLGSTDLHAENVIASGDVPVLIDLETLLSGEITAHEPLRGLKRSVLASHLLPNWMLRDTAAQDVGGLTGTAPGAKNLLRFRGETVALHRHADEVEDGFLQAYTFALHHKKMLREAVNVFAACRFRLLLRPTETYGRMAAFLQQCRAEEKAAYAEALLRRSYERDLRPHYAQAMRNVIKAERDALLGGDIPYFTVDAQGTDLCSQNAVVKQGFLALSPLESTRRRIDALSADDRTAQVNILQQALAAVRPLSQRTPVVLKGSLFDGIIRTLERGAVPRLSSGWMQLERAADGNLFLQSAGAGLYDGLLGILCCYAAVYAKTGKQSVRQKLLRHYEAFGNWLTAGGTVQADFSLQTGAAGQIAALLHIAALTEETMFASHAAALAARMEPERLKEKSVGDLLCGSAGLALSLPKLPQSVAVPLAKALLPELLKHAPVLTGTAHGAAGIALALAALQNVAEMPDCGARIAELLQWENQYFCESEKNWQDLRQRETRGFMTGWCSGAPGIGMARKRILAYSKNEKVAEICRRDIAFVCEKLKTAPPAKRDCLCCGSAARLMAATVLGNQPDKLYIQLENRLRTDTLRLYHAADTCDGAFGLMQGLAGIGYALAMAGDERCGEMLL